MSKHTIGREVKTFQPKIYRIVTSTDGARTSAYIAMPRLS